MLKAKCFQLQYFFFGHKFLLESKGVSMLFLTCPQNAGFLEPKAKSFVTVFKFVNCRDATPLKIYFNVFFDIICKVNLNKLRSN